jgi:hypothetical protein
MYCEKLTVRVAVVSTSARFHTVLGFELSYSNACARASVVVGSLSLGRQLAGTAFHVIADAIFPSSNNALNASKSTLSDCEFRLQKASSIAV